MRKYVLATVASLLVAAPCVAAAGDARWEAIAADGQGHWGFAQGQPDRDTARSKAVEYCKADHCRVEFAVTDRCLAYADNHVHGFWYGDGYAGAGDAAANIARHACNTASGSHNCQIVKVVCG